MMLFSKKESRKIDPQELSCKVDQLLEGYRWELMTKIEEFQALDNLRCMKHIRTWVLVSEIERGKILKKLLKLWVSGIIGWLFKFVAQKDMSMDKLQDTDLERVCKDTRQNYAKNTLKQINRELAKEFAKAGYRYHPVQLEETLDTSQWSKRRPRTAQGKFWWITSKLFSASKLPSILFVILSSISASMYFLTNWLTGIIQSALKITLLASILVHFFSGVANAVNIFYQWLEDIAEQIEKLCKVEELDSEALATQWIDHLKNQASWQITAPKESRSKKMALVSSIVVLIIGFTVFTYWPSSVPANNDIANDTTPIIEILDKEAFLQRMQQWGRITVLTKSGSDLVFERIIPKKIFAGTIPTTDLQIKVTYDYTTDFIVDLRELSTEDLEIHKGVVKVYLSKPALESIIITNDRKEMNGGVFAENGTPEEELEAFEPGDESYLDILRGNVEALLGQDHSLQNKVILEAKKNLRTRLLVADESITDVEVIIKGQP